MAATDFVYPSAAELQQVEQVVMPRLVMNDPLLAPDGVMPITNDDAYLLEWEQEDNYQGLQGVRGLDGQPSAVARIGSSRYQVQSGVYGEFSTVGESEITRARQLGSWGAPIDLAKTVRKEQDRLLQRRLDRIRWIGWNLISTGAFSVSGPSGAIHLDSYTMQTQNALVAWATVATARPVADFRAAKLKHRAKGVTFDSGARAYVNSATLNALLGNQNAADLYGMRAPNGATYNTLDALNGILIANELPRIVEYDEGYIDDAGTFQLWVPNNKCIVVGKRTTGARVAEYKLTRNATNPGCAPGPYTIVKDIQGPPRSFQVHDGHNGGPCFYFPSAVIIMTV
ncbi:MAG TPA: hypothetical protein VGN26_12445 [Armatimonadota bacterium]|jgi:hypothetical protein